MSYSVAFLVLGISAVLLIFLMVATLKLNSNAESKKREKIEAENKKRRAEAAAKGLLVTCPMCNSALMPGEDLFTRVYRPMNVPDQLCTISGCPHCYPRPENGAKRLCPVCHKEVPLAGHLIARLFNKTTGKKHVIVTGCNQCCYSGKH